MIRNMRRVIMGWTDHQSTQCLLTDRGLKMWTRKWPVQNYNMAHYPKLCVGDADCQQAERKCQKLPNFLCIYQSFTFMMRYLLLLLLHHCCSITGLRRCKRTLRGFDSFQLLIGRLTQWGEWRETERDTLILTVISELNAGWQSQLCSVCWNVLRPDKTK